MPRHKAQASVRALKGLPGPGNLFPVGGRAAAGYTPHLLREGAMKIELRPAGHEWTWVVRDGNLASLPGKRFSSVHDALRDARSGHESDTDDDDPPPLVA